MLPKDPEQRRKHIAERAKRLSFPWSSFALLSSIGVAVTASILHGFSFAYVLYPIICLLTMVGMLMFHFALEVALEQSPPGRPLLPLIWLTVNYGALFGVYEWLKSSWAAVGLALVAGSVVYAGLFHPTRRRRVAEARKRGTRED